MASGSMFEIERLLDGRTWAKTKPPKFPKTNSNFHCLSCSKRFLIAVLGCKFLILTASSWAHGARLEELEEGGGRHGPDVKLLSHQEPT